MKDLLIYSALGFTVLTASPIDSNAVELGVSIEESDRFLSWRDFVGRWILEAFEGSAYGDLQVKEVSFVVDQSGNCQLSTFFEKGEPISVNGDILVGKNVLVIFDKNKMAVGFYKFTHKVESDGQALILDPMNAQDTRITLRKKP